MDARDLFQRWAAFNGVGALGVALQLALVALLVHAAGLHYLVATAVAVQVTILHNFVWHQRWTWRDRRATSPLGVLIRLVKFNIFNGGISLVGNAIVMSLLAGGAGIEPVAANLAGIALCSLANFAASDALVFRSAGAAGSLTGR